MNMKVLHLLQIVKAFQKVVFLFLMINYSFDDYFLIVMIVIFSQS